MLGVTNLKNTTIASDNFIRGTPMSKQMNVIIKWRTLSMNVECCL